MPYPVTDASAAFGGPTLLDRRHALRFAVNSETSRHLIAAVGDTFWPARVLDLSARGARLVLRRRFEPGQTALVELANGRRVFSRTLAVRVAHVNERHDGSFVLGAEFARQLTQGELMDLLW